jgi:hypothetical protein
MSEQEVAGRPPYLTTKDTLAKLQRIAFLNGAIEGITLYAIWKNGQQAVGCLEKPLKEVIAPYQLEIQRLVEELSVSS